MAILKFIGENWYLNNSAEAPIQWQAEQLKKAYRTPTPKTICGRLAQQHGRMGDFEAAEWYERKDRLNRWLR